MFPSHFIDNHTHRKVNLIYIPIYWNYVHFQSGLIGASLFQLACTFLLTNFTDAFITTSSSFGDIRSVLFLMMVKFCPIFDVRMRTNSEFIWPFTFWELNEPCHHMYAVVQYHQFFTAWNGGNVKLNLMLKNEWPEQLNQGECEQNIIWCNAISILWNVKGIL